MWTFIKRRHVLQRTHYATSLIRYRARVCFQGEGWVTLGRAQLNLGEFGMAVLSFQRAIGVMNCVLNMMDCVLKMMNFALK